MSVEHKLKPRNARERLTRSEEDELRVLAREIYAEAALSMEESIVARVGLVIDSMKKGGKRQEVLVRSSSAAPYFRVTTREVEEH